MSYDLGLINFDALSGQPLAIRAKRVALKKGQHAKKAPHRMVLRGLGALDPNTVSVALAGLQAQSQRFLNFYQSDVSLQPYRSAVIGVMQHIQDALDWAPRNLVTIATQAMDQYQSFPYLAISPPSLTEQYQKDGWSQVYTAYKPIAKAFLAKEMDSIQAQGAQLDADADFWNAVAKYSGVQYMQDLWDKLSDALAGLKAQIDATNTGVSTVNDIASKYPNLPQSYRDANAQVQSQASTLISRARALVLPLGSSAAQAGGLGNPLIIVAGIAAATLIGITAGIWAIAEQFSSVQKQANQNATDVIKWRDQADNAAFNAGQISNDELVKRRDQSVAAANDISEHQGAAQVGLAVKNAASGFGMSLGIGIGVVGLIGVAGLLLYKRFAR